MKEKKIFCLNDKSEFNCTTHTAAPQYYVRWMTDQVYKICKRLGEVYYVIMFTMDEKKNSDV